MNTTDSEPENFYYQANRFGLNTSQPLNLLRADMGLRWRTHYESVATVWDRSASEVKYINKLRDRAEAIAQAFPPIV
jgi:hypothetical protein